MTSSSGQAEAQAPDADPHQARPQKMGGDEHPGQTREVLQIADASLLPQRPVTVSIGLVQSQSAEQLDHLLARLASCHGQAKREHNTVIG